MATLDDWFDDEPEGGDAVDYDAIRVLIKRRRRQMIVHSYLYYRLDTNIISDDLWQAWADELAKLQQNHPNCCKIECYDKEFEDWDGSTGMHLPAAGYERMLAEYILVLNEKLGQNDFNASVV